MLLADNFLVSQVAREALAQLATTTTLLQRVRMIGLNAWSDQAVEDGLVDAVIPLPFTVAVLLETIEANTDHGSVD